MKTLKINDILQVLGVEKKKSNVLIQQVSNDIHQMSDDTIVFHLNKREDLDVTQFDTLKNCFIVSDQPILINQKKIRNSIIHVLDVEGAYRQFIEYYRSLFDLPVVAITGTCGKATTKEMLKQVLEKSYTIAATISNKNALNYNLNYLLAIDDKTDFGIFETAISYPGDLIKGCQYFKPTIGVITNIGIDHLSGCKTLGNYIKTKGEMLAGLNYQGTLIINHDDENIKRLDLKPFKGKLITFGIKLKSDYQAENIVYQEMGMSFTLITKKKKYQVVIPGFGEHNVYNALAAIAVLDELGIPIEDAIQDLLTIQFIRSHLEFHQGLHNSIVIDDTWSSNPTSVKSAFEVLRHIGKDKNKIVVLGKISYLGDEAISYYEQIGRMVVEYGIDILITLDSFSNHIGKHAIMHHMDKNHVFHCRDERELKNTLEVLLDAHTIVLFKVSMFDKKFKKTVKYFIDV